MYCHVFSVHSVVLELRQYLDVVVDAVAVSLKVDVGHGEVDERSLVHRDGPDADGVVLVRVRIVGRHQSATVRRKLTAAR